jgi:hypothetical protein
MNWRYGALLVAAVLVAGCSAGPSTNGTGTVQGTFERAGGPAIVVNGKAETPVFPLAGIVTFTGAGGQKFSVSVGKSGVFSTRLPAGSYAVSGVSGPDRSAPTTARVQAGKTSRILVVVVVS